MFEENSQNILLRIKYGLSKCGYNPNMKEFIANRVLQAMIFPKRTLQSRYFRRNLGADEIIMVWFPMNVLFMSKSFNVPIEIFFMKNFPFEPPQIFIELDQGRAINPKNENIDINTRRIMTNTLRNWHQFSNIEDVMNEIFESFSYNFPIYKVNQNNSSNNKTNIIKPTNKIANLSTNTNNKTEIINSANKIVDLENRIKELEESMKEKDIMINNLKNEIQKLSLKNNQLNIENNNISEKLNKIMLESNEQINKKEKLIKQYELKISKFSFEFSPGENAISIILISSNENIISSFICKNTDNFNFIENKFYEKYSEYKGLDNNFILNGRKIDKNKSLYENKIKNNDIITIFN